MGTRADFYIGKGKDAEWLGSIAWDGFDIPQNIRQSADAEMFKKNVIEFIAGRDDGTKPEQGWPWPWETSALTDCHYWFFDGKTWEGLPDENSNDHYVPAMRTEGQGDDEDEATFFELVRKGEVIEFPDMSSRKNVTLGKRSGVLIFKAK